MKIKIVEVMPTQGSAKGLLRGVILNGEPEIGKVYQFVEYKKYSTKQRRLFEPLVRLYFNSLCFPEEWECKTWEDLRDKIKLKLGQGVEWYEYTANDYSIQRVRTLEEVPEDVLDGYNSGNHYRIRIYRLLSTTKYDKKQFWDMTDSLIRQMIFGGVGQSRYGKKFNEILDEIGFTE